MPRKKSKKRKQVRYRKVTFKLTSQQMKSLENFCTRRGTSPIKFIKKHLEPFLTQYRDIKPVPPPNHRQLTIFDQISEVGETTLRYH
ncbi:MAG: hypothetical protein ACP5O2_07645 [Bacteroidales bacterium]